MKREVLLNKIKGSMYGFAIGDAMGATTEFCSKKYIRRKYGRVTSIIGGGWLNLKAGQVTDDTQMMFCICDAIASADYSDILRKERSFIRICSNNFIVWKSSKPIDIGGQCSRGIYQLQEGFRYARLDNEALGNGSLMRALPLALAYELDLNVKQGRLTHNNTMCDIAIDVYFRNVNSMIINNDINNEVDGLMKPEGHVLNTLNNALYHSSTCPSIRWAVEEAVNNGGDADTIAALTGGLIGAKCGFNSLPYELINGLNKHARCKLDSYSEMLCDIRINSLGLDVN